MDELPCGYTAPPGSPGPSEEWQVSKYERDDLGTEDVREGADDLGDTAKREADEAKEGAKSVTDRLTDAVEDVIPDDGDNDGH